MRAVGYRCELGNDQDELQLCSAAIRLGQYPHGLYRSAMFYDVSIATAVPAAIDHVVQSEKLINKSKHSCIKDVLLVISSILISTQIGPRRRQIHYCQA